MLFAMAIAVLAATLTSAVRPAPAFADLGDGHTRAYNRDRFPQWSDHDRKTFQLDHGRITRNLVTGESLTVCSTDFPKATETAVDRWNARLQRDVMTFEKDPGKCRAAASSGVWHIHMGVTAVFVEIGEVDTNFLGERIVRGEVLENRWCRGTSTGRLPYACVQQDGVQSSPGFWRTKYGRLEVIVNPEKFCHDIPDPSIPTPAAGCTQNDDNLLYVLTHELGHALSLADYRCYYYERAVTNTNPHPDFIDVPTIMNTRSFSTAPRAQDCNPTDGSPTDRDKEDYTKIYTPGAVIVKGNPSVAGRTVTLEWDQSEVFVESEFEIQREVGETWLVLATARPNATEATLTNQPGGVQRYQIVARTMALPTEQRHGHSHGPASNIVEAAIQLTTPTNVRVTSRTTTSLTLEWTYVSSASRYQLRRIAPSASCDGAVQVTTTHRSQRFLGLEADTQYRLCVRAVLDTNASVASEWASTLATTKTQQLAKPGSPSAGSATTSTLTLSWSAVDDDDLGEYEVRRSGSSTMWKVDAGDTSYEFTGLSTYTPYTLSVRALPKSGSGRTPSGWASAATTRTARPQRPEPYSYNVVVTSPTQDRTWFGPNLTCFIITEARQRTDVYWVSYYWSSTAVNWVPRTSLLWQGAWGDWYEVSRTVCMFARSASNGWIVGAGVYELVWPEQSVQFTVPAEATVELNWRKRGSGEDAAVFSVAAGAELVVTPGMLDEDAVTGLAESTDPTLSAIAASLQLVDADSDSADAGTVGGASDEGCADATKPESGATQVDLADGVCMIAEGGGEVRVADSTQTLTLTLTSGRDWAVLAEPYSGESDDDAFWLIDLATGGWIALNPADGAELARHAPADADGLPALLDAIAASASAPAAAE